jgi:hypothetical protein
MSTQWRGPNGQPMIAMADCVDRQVYRVHTRNLDPLCVYSEKQRGFYGIRTKFNSRFIDVEFHHEASVHHGTAIPYELVTVEKAIDPAVMLRTTYPTVCNYCGLAVHWSGETGPDGRIVAPAPWVHTVPSPDCPDADPTGVENRPLRLFLNEINAADEASRGELTPYEQAKVSFDAIDKQLRAVSTIDEMMALKTAWATARTDLMRWMRLEEDD